VNGAGVSVRRSGSLSRVLVTLAAVVLLTNVAPAYAQDREALLAAASAGLRAGRASEAERTARRLLEGNPEDTSARLTLGLALGKQGRNDDAAAEFETILAAHPGNPDAALNLGVVRVRQGRYREAQKQLAIAESVPATAAGAMLFRAHCEMKLGREADAAATLARVQREHPERARSAAFERGVLAFRAAELDTARSIFTSVIDDAPAGDELVSRSRTYLERIEVAEDERFELYAWAGVEFDSNVGLTNGLLDEFVSKKSDVRGVFLAGISGVPLENARTRVRAGWEVFQSAHNELHSFDIHDQRVWAQVEHEPRGLGNVLIGVRASYDYYFLDEEDFLGEATVAPTVTLGLSDLGDTEIGYRWQHRSFYLEPFDGNSIIPDAGPSATRDANIHNILLRQYLAPTDALWGWVGYAYVIHDATEDDVASESFAYDAHVLDAGVSYDLRLPVVGNLDLLAAVEYRNESYDKASATTQVSSDGTLGGSERGDDEIAVYVGADRELTSWLRARVGWFGLFNKSNDARFDYDRHVFSGVLEFTY
jgi:Tfp pilus assembly protein PilF